VAPGITPRSNTGRAGRHSEVHRADRQLMDFLQALLEALPELSADGPIQ